MVNFDDVGGWMRCSLFIIFGRNKWAVHRLRIGRKVYMFALEFWCIPPWAHSCTLGGERFGTFDGVLGDIPVWEFSGTFDEEFVCIPPWEHFGSSVWEPFCTLVCNRIKRYEVITLCQGILHGAGEMEFFCPFLSMGNL